LSKQPVMGESQIKSNHDVDPRKKSRFKKINIFTNE